MVRKWIGHRKQHSFGTNVARVSGPCSACGSILGQRIGTIPDASVISIEFSVRLKIRMERKSEEATLIASRSRDNDLGTEVQKSCRDGCPWLEYFDKSRLLNDKDPIGSVVCVSKQYGT